MLNIMLSLFGLIMSMFIFFEWSYFFCGLLVLSFIMGSFIYFEGGFMYSSMGMVFDLLSYMLVYLTFWIVALMFLASVMVYNYNKFSREFSLTIGILCFFLITMFFMGDLVWLYIFFEASLIPTFFLISGWGYQPERLSASLYLFFYTMVGSLPLLLGILYLGSHMSTLSFSLFSVESYEGILMCLVMMGAFLIKMPMFLFHLWLPKAHVEAPVSGSMILAGVLLKLGGYGLLRVMILFPLTLMIFGKVFLVLSLVGGVLISFMCLRQFDLKALIAYSSVVHMGLALAGMMVVGTWGHQGTLTLMLGHGLCSSGLFAGANIIYERGGTRSMLLNKGMINIFPSMVLWWFVLCVCNMAAPPSLNLLGEISLMVTLVSWSIGVCGLLAGVSFFSAAYSIYLFAMVSHGRVLGSFGFFDIKSREFMVLMLHWIPLNVIIMKSDLVFTWLYSS